MATAHIEDEENKVTFVPHLYLQRRAWVLDLMRREAVKSVLDIGCGEGALLSCLANAAVSGVPSSSSTTYPEDYEEIRVRKLAGIDIDASELEWAVKSVSPLSSENEDKAAWNNQMPRWESLEVKVWNSSFEDMNSSFCWNGADIGYECIASTEVIEHLPPEVFPNFTAVILGKYRPRLLLLTTPNYTYNARFRTAPTSDAAEGGNIDDGGYSDPTGRTTRIFRHDDHKFEWTTEEFTQWCQAEAEKYGYDVTVHGVGRCLEGGDQGLGFASQTALFRLQPSASPNVPASEDVTTTTAEVKDPAPIFSFLHEAHPSTGKPLPYPEILGIIKSVFESWDTPQMNIQELWTEPTISIACGGLTEHLLNAIRKSGIPEDKWKIVDDGRKWDVSIHWGAFEKKGSWIKEGDTNEEFELEEEFERSVIVSEGWDSEEEEEEEEERYARARLARSSEVEVESVHDNEVGSWSVLSSHSGWGVDTRDSVWASQCWSDAAARSPHTA